jgi:hypothetical protein
MAAKDHAMRCLRCWLFGAVAATAVAAHWVSAADPAAPSSGPSGGTRSAGPVGAVGPMPRRYRPYDPYNDNYLAGYRYVPYPLNDPIPHVGPNHWVALYDYGFFGAKYRKPSKLNVGFNEYMRSYRRGFVTP